MNEKLKKDIKKVRQETSLYKCGCGLKYSTFPSFLTHCKNKHQRKAGGPYPKGSIVPKKQYCKRGPKAELFLEENDDLTTFNYKVCLNSWKNYLKVPNFNINFMLMIWQLYVLINPHSSSSKHLEKSLKPTHSILIITNLESCQSNIVIAQKKNQKEHSSRKFLQSSITNTQEQQLIVMAQQKIIQPILNLDQTIFARRLSIINIKLNSNNIYGSYTLDPICCIQFPLQNTKLSQQLRNSTLYDANPLNYFQSYLNAFLMPLSNTQCNPLNLLFAKYNKQRIPKDLTFWNSSKETKQTNLNQVISNRKKKQFKKLSIQLTIQIFTIKNAIQTLLYCSLKTFKLFLNQQIKNALVMELIVPIRTYQNIQELLILILTQKTCLYQNHNKLSKNSALKQLTLKKQKSVRLATKLEDASKEGLIRQQKLPGRKIENKFLILTEPSALNKQINKINYKDFLRSYCDEIQLRSMELECIDDILIFLTELDKDYCIAKVGEKRVNIQEIWENSKEIQQLAPDLFADDLEKDSIEFIFQEFLRIVSVDLKAEIIKELLLFFAVLCSYSYKIGQFKLIKLQEFPNLEWKRWKEQNKELLKNCQIVGKQTYDMYNENVECLVHFFIKYLKEAGLIAS